MSIWESLRRGIHTLSRMGRVCLIFYSALTAAALLTVAPAIGVVIHSLGSSAWAEDLATHLDGQWIGELLAGHGTSSSLQILPVVAGIFAVSLMVDLFLLGGALRLFCEREPFSMGAFFAGCGRNFAVLIRLGMVSTIFYGAAVLLWLGLSALGDSLWGEGSAATPLVYWSWFAASLGVSLLGMVNLLFDYARIYAVREGTPRAWHAGGAALRFVLANLQQAVSLYLALWFLALLGIAAYLLAARLLASSLLVVVLLMFLVRQFAIFGKIWLRLLFYAAQWEMLDALTPRAAAPEKDAPPEPAVSAAEVAVAPDTE